jgi:hypothetical protein
MWVVVKTLIKAELVRLWRRLLKRPDPPKPYAQFRVPRERPEPGAGDVD